MITSCHAARDMIAADLATDITDNENRELGTHLEECGACRRYKQGLLDDHELLESLVASMDARVRALQERIVAGIGETNPTSVAEPCKPTPRRWVRYLTAAAALVACAVTLHLVVGTGTARVVWAEVIARVENADDFICRWHMESDLFRDGPVDGIRYKSKEHGTRDDQYQNDRLMIRTYWVPKTLEEITLHVYDQAYIVKGHTREEFEHRSMQSDAQAMVSFFKSYPYRELRSRTMDGVRVSGIELEDPDFIRGAFDSGRYRLWVDQTTGWPVRLETHFEADNGKLQVDVNFFDFQWDPVLPAREVEAAIPDDYQLALKVEAPIADEEHTVAALRGIAEVQDGRYPSTLTFGSVTGSVIRDIRRSPGGRDRVPFVEQMMVVRNAVAFYVKLENAGADVAYHGNHVSARDFDQVLLRWRQDDGTYRVIYGDLRAEDLTAEELARVELDP